MTEKLQKECSTYDDWLLVHRVDLHNALRRLAEQTVGGLKPQILLSKKIKSIVRKLNYLSKDFANWIRTPTKAMWSSKTEPLQKLI